MKLLISRGNFERVCAGLSPIERERLAEQVQLYPDGDPPRVFVADQERIGNTLGDLMRTEEAGYAAQAAAAGERWRARWETVMRPLPTVIDETHVFRDWELEGFRDLGATDEGELGAAPSDAADMTLPAPWEQISPGCWVAPVGTPPPWADQIVNDAVATASTDWDDPDAQAPPVTAETVRKAIDRADHLGPPRQLKAGDLALTALRLLAAPEREGWPPPGVLAKMTGVPIVRDDALPSNGWQLVNPVSGDVLLQGAIGPSVEELTAVIDKAVEDLAEEYGIPRHLLE